MAAPLCPGCQRPMVFQWDRGRFVCAFCRYTADERCANLLRLGGVGGINWVDRLKLKLSIDEALRPRVTLT